MKNNITIITNNKYENIFIRIKNKYTSVEDLTFRLDELTHFYPANNNGKTVVIMLKAMNFCPTIRYSDFSDFFTFIIQKIATVNNDMQLFELIVNTDLSCEWHQVA